MRMFMAITLGLIFGAATMLIGLGLAGGGHGWSGPLFFSMLAVILYPVAFARALRPAAGSIEIDLMLLVGGGLLDLFVLMSAFAESKYIVQMWKFDEGPFFISLWVVLWSGWQILTAVALIRRKLATRAGSA